MQTYLIPAGGGAVFETVFDKDASGEGIYAFVTHSFADAEKGAVGMIQVGTPKQFKTWRTDQCTVSFDGTSRPPSLFLAVGLIIGVWMIARRELFQAFPPPYIVERAHPRALRRLRDGDDPRRRALAVSASRKG